MKDIHLTPQLKAYYMKDFTENVLACDNDWKLDQDLADLLVEINRNSNVQTLYSKRYNQQKRFADDESYIMFAYTEQVEQKLFKRIIPEITSKHCFSEGFDETACYYTFTYPVSESENLESGIGLGCTNDKDYFNISRIRIYLISHDIEKHKEFWGDVTEMLANCI